MRTFDFNNVDEVSDKGLTQPGTINVFTLTKVEFGTSNNQKDYMECTFDEGHSSFKYRFYMTEGAFPRVQSLYKAVVGQKLEGQVNEQQLIAALQGKQLALKVIGRVADNGRGYPDLAFGGFAKPVAQKDELQFIPSEMEKVQAAKAANENYQAATADSEGQNGAAPAATAQPQATGANDDF